jgi:hypothetical protein
MGEKAVIYDITDDWALASIPPQEKQLIQAQDELLCKKADLVVCVRRLWSKAARRSRNGFCFCRMA